MNYCLFDGNLDTIEYILYGTNKNIFLLQIYALIN